MKAESISFAPWQFVAINNPFDHFGMFGGVGSGKTFTGSHYGINRLKKFPKQTGFIGANTYDQLSQATLRELFHWLDNYDMPFVIDRMPPPEWGAKKALKKYSNVLSVKNGIDVTTVFTRVLGDGNPLRGIEFSWYWLDETRDTPEETHDIVLSRMRESEETKGLITTTPNGEDWTYQRFVRNANKDQKMYGSMHVRTIEAVRAGILTQRYYDTMRASYSALMAAQELDALHLNVKGGRAYYAFGGLNKTAIAPWGDVNPSKDRPLVIGCDFNFQPAPCIWMVGQLGPNLWSPDGIFYGDCIHWFGEISDTEISTPDMTEKLVSQFPGFFYYVFGDASGNRGQTSNAGEHDYHQMAAVFQDYGFGYTIDVDQANPLVRNRVENMNRLARNSIGEVRMTYNPHLCPNFDADVRMVGWKQTVQTGQGKLDDGGDVQRTHATDGAGYAVYKLFPFGNRGEIIDGVASQVRNTINQVV